MILRRHLVLSGLAGACGAAFAEFRGPLDTASVPARGAERRSLLSVAAAGNRLVAVGMRGLILISDDGGGRWRQVPLAVSVDLVSVFFHSSQRGWACGHQGLLIKTEDGGLTWTVQFKGMDFGQVLLKQYEQAAASGEAGAKGLLETLKLNFAAGPEQPLLGVWFADENTGWIVSTFGMILGTQDGGKSWSSWMEQVDNPDQLHYYSIVGTGGEVFITSERGRLFKWDRARRRFSAIETGYMGGLFGVVGSAQALIAFGLQGTALRSRDGGVTWQRLDTGLRVGLNAGVLLPDGRTAIVSQDGRLLLTPDQGNSFTVTRIPRPGLLTGLALAANGQLVAVGFNGVHLLQP